MYQHGDMAASQELAAIFSKRLDSKDPVWAARFRILEAQSAAWRGLNQEVLTALSSRFPAVTDPEIHIRRTSLIGLAQAHLHQFEDADRQLEQAQSLCKAMDRGACSYAFASIGGLALERGQYQDAFHLYSQSLALARKFHLPFDESTALMDLAVTCLHEERFDEAIDWMHASNTIAERLGAGDILLNNMGNLGWAYYRLGDPERALALFQDAEQRAVTLGDTDSVIAWLTTSGRVYQDSHERPRAMSAYQKALGLALTINSKEKAIGLLELLAHISIDEGKLDEANTYIDQVRPLLGANNNHLDSLIVTLAEGRIAAARRQDQQAEEIFRKVEGDPQSQTSMRIGADHELASLFESEDKSANAERMYRTALSTFESAREQLKNEDSKLPYLTNATGIYDDYIHFLVKQGKTGEALEIADQSRSRTLAQGLGLFSDKASSKSASWHPMAIAQKAKATLLFYWLGEKQSYLWAITRNKTALFQLPSQSEISPVVERYRKALLGPSIASDTFNPDGNALYRTLVAPASNLIPSGSTVAILSDGPLSLLNFETLIVSGTAPHYWIEDASLISAPSLFMLASATPSENASQNLLVIGDPVSPAADYPELPMAALEMRLVQKHFAAENETTYARQRATSEAYLSSAPQQYSYIHFVAHGVSSQTDPLDSAIILSRTSSAEDSFKLHAREIIQHPIHARLVTISACFGSGTRSYAGEGLVGLSWAFLHAGAHNVIGALWEVSDESTPRLMNGLYQGLEDGLSPSAALRRAKLSLLHSQGNFREPFFWAPFQIYTGL